MYLYLGGSELLLLAKRTAENRHSDPHPNQLWAIKELGDVLGASHFILEEGNAKPSQLPTCLDIVSLFDHMFMPTFFLKMRSVRVSIDVSLTARLNILCLLSCKCIVQGLRLGSKCCLCRVSFRYVNYVESSTPHIPRVGTDHSEMAHLIL